MISNLSKVLLPNTLGKVAKILSAQNFENLDLCMITAKETNPTLTQRKPLWAIINRARPSSLGKLPFSM
jgi:hypothetical protein